MRSFLKFFFHFIFTLEDDKIVVSCNYVFGKLKFLLNHGFTRPILLIKHRLLPSECFAGKLVLGTLDKLKFPYFSKKVVVNNYCLDPLYNAHIALQKKKISWRMPFLRRLFYFTKWWKICMAIFLWFFFAFFR